MKISDKRFMVDALVRWRQSPLAFVMENWGEHVNLDDWQIDVLNAFPTNPMISMQACKGPGKTCTLAWLGLNFISTRVYSKTAATSIDGKNLRDNLWAEFAKWIKLSPYLDSLLEWNTQRISVKAEPENWFISARTWPKTGDSREQADTLAGLHADYTLFLIDESGGIPPAVMVSAEAALSSGIECHVVQAGNPSSITGALYQASRDRLPTGRWHVIEITNDPDDPKRSKRASLEYAQSQIKAYGRDNPWVMVNVLGKFPAGTINTLISEEDVRAAMARYHRAHVIADSVRILGVDVARQGLDASVIAPRQGLQMFPMRRYRNITGLEGASIVNRMWAEFDADACFIDATGGYGWPWIEQLGVLGRQSIPVQFAGKASNDDRYANKRAEMYFLLVDWIKSKGGALPDNHPQLAEALWQTTYYHKHDRLILEEKDQIRDRIGYSPDEADAAALTFAEPVQPKSRQRVANYDASAEWNPFTSNSPQMDNSGGDRYRASTDWNPYR